MKSIASLALFLVFLAGAAAAQPRKMEQTPSPGLAEAVTFASSLGGRGRVGIHVRVSSVFLIPVRNTDPSFPHPFRRRGELLVELLDSTGISAAREIRRIEMGAVAAEPRDEMSDWHQSVFRFDVPPGTYTLLLEVDDLESRRTVTDRDRRVFVPRLHPDSLLLSTPFLLADTLGPSLPDTVVPHNYGGDLLFGHPGTFYLEVAGPTVGTGPVSVTTKLVPGGERGGEAEPTVSDTLPDARAGTGITLVPVVRGNEPAYHVTRADSGGSVALLVPFAAHTLPLRPYRLILTVRAGTAERSVTIPMKVIWPDMPRSLRDVDYALDALRYIVSEHELDSLREGGFDRRREALESFWSRRDRTPGTAYNEVMTQYYRRVDHSTRAFSTLRQPDGFRTDRGRIYVLFGPPTRSDRTLDPHAGFQETWVYDHLQRKFVFADRAKTGDYQLLPATGQ